MIEELDNRTIESHNTKSIHLTNTRHITEQTGQRNTDFTGLYTI